MHFAADRGLGLFEVLTHIGVPAIVSSGSRSSVVKIYVLTDHVVEAYVGPMYSCR